MKINDIALTEIAHEAAKKEKKELAKKLLEKETSITRKIPVLVWMKEYESSLEEAFLGKDTNLINLVLIKFFGLANSIERRSLYEKCLKLSPELVIQLINFLKKTNRKDFLGEFLELSKGSEIVQSEIINNAAYALRKNPDTLHIQTSELLRNRMVELRKCKDTAETNKDKDTVALLENEIRLVDYHLKDPTSTTQSIDKFKIKTIEELCIESILKTGGDVSSKSDFVRLTTKEFKLTAKKINMMKIKAFALMGQLPLLRDFVITLNKKSEVIHYDIIFEYLDSQGLQQFSVDICKNCANFKVQQEYFTKIKDIKNLADACVKYRRPDVLQEIEKRVNKEMDRAIIKEALAKL